MRRISTGIWISGFLVALCSPARADYSVGGSFGAPGYGARAFGMAGAAIVTAHDESGTYWNPAALSRLEQHRLGFAYSDIVPDTDTRQSFFAYSGALKRGPKDEPGMVWAKHAIGLLYSNVRLELTDGEKYSENVLSIAYAWSPLYAVSAGATVSYLKSTSDVAGFDASGLSVTAGLRLALLRKLDAAFVLRDVASQVEFGDGVTYSLPRSATLGFAYRATDFLTAETDFEMKFGGVSRISTGAESVLFRGFLALRAGFSARTSGESRITPHAGMGLRLPDRLFLDYSADLDRDEALSKTHRISLAIGI